MSLPRSLSEPTMGVCEFDEPVKTIRGYQATWDDGKLPGYKTCLINWIKKQDACAKKERYDAINLSGLTDEHIKIEKFCFQGMSQGQKNRHIEFFAPLL